MINAAKNIPSTMRSTEDESLIRDIDVYKCYRESKYLSIKHSSYFRTYEELLRQYRGQKITFIEIGVLNGGSLFMWRNYFGSQARIIGVDLNPGARKWEKEGFEIFIGSQADPEFWHGFFAAVGNVDVILDDGGHTNEQQIITAHHAIPHIKDGGMLIVEDTHSSYLSEFGNPSKYSFISYAKTLIDAVNSRYPTVNASTNDMKECVLSISFFESIVAFKINRPQCFTSSLTSNDGISSDAEDFRERGSHLGVLSNFRASINRSLRFMKHIPLMTKISEKLFAAMVASSSRMASRKLKRYFS